MTRMTGPDCVVMCNLINTYIHTYIHTYILPCVSRRSPPEPLFTNHNNGVVPTQYLFLYSVGKFALGSS